MTRKCPQMTSRAPRNEIGTGSPISRPTFWDQFELGGYPQICPRRTQNDPLMAQNAYKSPHWSELVGTTWNKVWNRFSHVQADILGPITVRWVPKFGLGGPKWLQDHFPALLGQNWGYPTLPIGPKRSAWTSNNMFQYCSTLYHLF